MRHDVRSYQKTVGIILGLLVVVSVLGFFAVRALESFGLDALARIGAAVFTAAGTVLLLAAVCGLVVAQRARRAAAGEDDLYLALNRSRAEVAFDASHVRVPLRGLRRALGAPQLLVGDTVKVKSLHEIKATLDSSGCLEGMPFMAEMERFCGKSARIFRVVDKVYDYGGKKDLRRLHDGVLLKGLRCDGAAHGGCQAECYILWKTAWLAPAGGELAAEAALPTGPGPGPNAADPAATVYTCQYTQIVASSQEMNPRGVRQYLRPLLAGNITAPAFLATLATLAFNAIQKLRRGAGFPGLAPSAPSGSADPELRLQVGDIVRVRSAEEIGRTLNNRGKNKGLWFDRDMLKHSGRRYRVRARVEGIIDDVTGKMLRMRAPCILLDGVDGSGEFLRFSAQHDYVFWREAWLERSDGATAANGLTSQPGPDPPRRG